MIQESKEQAFDPQAFDPQAFGLTFVCDRRQAGRSSLIRGDLYLIRYEETEKSHDSYRIVMNEEIAKSVSSVCGSEIDFGFHPNGTIFIWPGKSAGIIKNYKNNKGPIRYSIGATKLGREYTKHFGTFKHIYFDPKYNGNHVEFVPTGKRD